MNQPVEFYFWAIPLALVTLAAAGYALKHLALGRFVGDDPVVCRRCKYDLVGLQSAICPECGADLSRPRATRKGVRVRSPIRVAAGIAVATLLLTWGVLFENRLRQTLTRELEYAPSSWLVCVAAGDSQWLRADNAAVLLMSRLRNGILSDGALVDIAEAVFTDGRHDFVFLHRVSRFDHWHEYLDEAQSRGLITESQVRDFLGGLVVLSTESWPGPDGGLVIAIALRTGVFPPDDVSIPQLFRDIRLLASAGCDVASTIEFETLASPTSDRVISRAIVELPLLPSDTTLRLAIEMNVLDPRTHAVLEDTWSVECIVFENGAIAPRSAYRKGREPELLKADETKMLPPGRRGVTF